jgi:hypothetical protein
MARTFVCLDSIWVGSFCAFTENLQKRRLSVTNPDNWIRRPFDNDFTTEQVYGWEYDEIILR